MEHHGRIYLILLTCCLLGLGLPVAALRARDSEAAATGCMEVLQDGSFEAGGQGWLRYSAQGYDLISDFNPRTGDLGAYLAGVNSADDRLSQQITLPEGVSTLRAWWYLATAETAGVFDRMVVALLQPDGSWLADLVAVDNTAQVGVWDELVVDLSPYAGQTVILRFTGRTDDTNISDFYLDDVSVAACVTDPLPTATATSTGQVTPPVATATPTASRTPSVTPKPTLTATQAPPTATPSTTPTLGQMPTATASPTPSATPKPTLTATQAPPTATPSATPTLGQMPTATASPTASRTPEPDARRNYLPFTIR